VHSTIIKIRVDKLRGFISEPYREYMENPMKLKKGNRELSDLIDRAVK
jgi:hypothetical protein